VLRKRTTDLREHRELPVWAAFVLVGCPITAAAIVVIDGAQLGATAAKCTVAIPVAVVDGERGSLGAISAE